MARYSLWNDDYWLLLLQIYLKKPVGVKPLYSKPLVDLSLELHIAPAELYERLFELRQRNTPRMQKLWETYGEHPRKLSNRVKTLRKKAGFGSNGTFFEGVELNESFEKDFRPVDGDSIMPIQLIMILDLYFRLTPNTMVVETPEIIELSNLIKIPVERIVEIMSIYQQIDPCLHRDTTIDDPLLPACQKIWNRYGNDNPQRLAALAAQLKDYFA